MGSWFTERCFQVLYITRLRSSSMAMTTTHNKTKYEFQYLALTCINQAGGLYGRILTEDASTDQAQWPVHTKGLYTQGLYTQTRSRLSHTDRLSSVNN